MRALRSILFVLTLGVAAYAQRPTPVALIPGAPAPTPAFKTSSTSNLTVAGGAVNWCSTSAIAPGSYNTTVFAVGMASSFPATVSVAASALDGCPLMVTLAVPIGLRVGTIYSIGKFGTYTPTIGNPKFVVVR